VTGDIILVFGPWTIGKRPGSSCLRRVTLLVLKLLFPALALISDLHSAHSRADRPLMLPLWLLTDQLLILHR
jgi:hypothetical protein